MSFINSYVLHILRSFILSFIKISIWSLYFKLQWSLCLSFFNPLSGFYMRATLAFNGLTSSSAPYQLVRISTWQKFQVWDTEFYLILNLIRILACYLFEQLNETSWVFSVIINQPVPWRSDLNSEVGPNRKLRLRVKSIDL